MLNKSQAPFLETLTQLTNQLSNFKSVLVTELKLTPLDVDILFLAQQNAEPITVPALGQQVNTNTMADSLAKLTENGLITQAKTDKGTSYIEVTQGGYDAVVNAEFIFERNLRNLLSEDQFKLLQSKMEHLIGELQNVQGGLDSVS